MGSEMCIRDSTADALCPAGLYNDNIEDGLIRYVSSPKGLLDASSPFECIAQQTNCVSCVGFGFAGDVATAFSYGDPYASRSSDLRRKNTALTNSCSVPGTNVILECPDHDDSRWQPKIVNMMAQWNPGKPLACVRRFPPNNQRDDTCDRIRWFKSCLTEISRDTTITSIAFPDRIGCGLAGESWLTYKRCLEEFAR
mgnify:CR=1 FL=1